MVVLLYYFINLVEEKSLDSVQCDCPSKIGSQIMIKIINYNYVSLSISLRCAIKFQEENLTGIMSK
jgi:hypothetical protein